MNFQGCGPETGKMPFGQLMVVGLVVTVEQINMCMNWYLAITGLETELVTNSMI